MYHLKKNKNQVKLTERSSSTVPGNSAMQHADHRDESVSQQKLVDAIGYNNTVQAKVNINNDNALEKEADEMGERSLQLNGSNNLQVRQRTVNNKVFQLQPSEELIKKKEFIENRIDILLQYGPTPTRLKLFQYDVKELKRMHESTPEGQAMLSELLWKVEQFIGMIGSEAGLTIIDPHKFFALKSIFRQSEHPIPKKEEYASQKGAKDYVARLSVFHAELNTKAKELGFKVLARFFVEGEGEHVVHPGVNSWARFNASKPGERILPEYRTDDVIKTLATSHMIKGHDIGEKKEGILDNSPLFSGTEDVGELINADSPYNKNRIKGLAGVSEANTRRMEAASFSGAASSSSSLRGARAASSPKAGSSNSLVRQIHKPATSESTEGEGESVSDRIIRLIWGFDSARHAKNLNTGGPVAVANTLIFIAIPLNYPHLYTYQQIGATEKKCCFFERENTVFAQLTNIKSLAIGSLPNFFPFMQTHDEGSAANERSEYIRFMQAHILKPNSYVNIKSKGLAEQKELISGIDKEIEKFKQREKKIQELRERK